MRLAWRCGYAHPDLMLAGLSSRQYSEIEASLDDASQAGPSGDDLIDQHLARVNHTLLVVNGAKVDLDDCYLRPGNRSSAEVPAQAKSASLLEKARHVGAILAGRGVPMIPAV
jgi:hypothetical protein